jgi:hypothetical protein
MDRNFAMAGFHIMTLAESVAISGLVLNILVAVIGLTWGVAKIRDAVRTEIEEHREKFDGHIDILRQNTGEMGAALRQKINDVELYARDTFMRRDSFQLVQAELKEQVKALGDKIENRLERMEQKIDDKH